MPVLIKGKVIRNIPEQVSQNTKEIKALKTELYEKEYTIQDINIVGGHLIITTYGGEEIDAGAIKNIVSMSIDGSQHLIATYNDGSTQDLGAIFSGNVNISGDLTVTGDLAAADITGDSIIENMSGYSFINPISAGTREIDYAGVVKNGNKVTFVVAGAFTTDASHPATGYYSLANFGIPAVVGAKLFPLFDNNLSFQKIPMVEDLYNSTEGTVYAQKDITNQFLYYYILSAGLATSTKYYFRIEATFLLSENLAE